MSERYRREFDLWLEAFKEEDLFEEIVEGFDQDWSSIYKELHRIFKRDVWKPNNDRVSIARSNSKSKRHTGQILNPEQSD